MISDRTLDIAVARNLITSAQAAGLRQLEAQAPDPAVFGEDEKIRLITGFGDIFVTIGLVLFLGALCYFAQAIAGAIGMGAAGAAASWGLAEFFTRKRRMALPSIVLLVTFAGFIFFTAGFCVDLLYRGRSFGWSLWPGFSTAGGMIGAGIATAVAVGMHYRRFRVPITVAAGAAALIMIVLGFEALVMGGSVGEGLKPTLLICGLVVFIAAMRFDMSDPERRTRRADIAFWLHLLAAPLIVHTLIGGIATRSAITPTSAGLILAIFAGLAFVAVLIDRRAVLVSGLSYAGYAFGALAMKAGATDVAIPLTVLLLGALVLLLSAGWHGLRKAVLPLLPQALARRLPRTYMGATPTETSST